MIDELDIEDTYYTVKKLFYHTYHDYTEIVND